MKNLLFISTYPFPLDMGYKLHAYYLLKALAGLYNVYCIFFIPPNQETPLYPDASLKELNIKSYQFCHYKKQKNDGRYIQFFRSIFSFPSTFMRLATHRQGMRTINSFIEKFDIDIIHFEHFWYTNYAFGIRSGLKKVIVYHDLHHNVFSQLSKIEKKYHRKLMHLLSQIKFYVFESILDRKVSLKIFLNPLEMLSFPNNSIHLPHIINSDINYNCARMTNFFNILFIGSYNHPPNRRSVEYIINQILPRLSKLHNNFKIHIVGPGTEKFKSLLLNKARQEYVVIHGFKKDINQAFKKMDLALFPILDGGGIKTKILDAMAAGVPIVTTPNGVHGLKNLPTDCISVAKSQEEFVSEIGKLMQSYSLRCVRSERGKCFIDQEHSFDALVNKMMQCYSYR